MSQLRYKCAVLLFVALALSNCAETSTPRLTPTPFAGLVLRMNYYEAIKVVGEPYRTPIVYLNKFHQIYEINDYKLYKTEKDKLEGKETLYRLYFYIPKNDWQYELSRLVHWSEEGNWERDEAILKKTRFADDADLFRLGMTYKEVAEIYAEKTQWRILPRPWIMSNRYGQIIYFYDFNLERAITAKKTWYRVYFRGHTIDDFRLVGWAVKADWKKADTLIKKTRFK